MSLDEEERLRQSRATHHLGYAVFKGRITRPEVCERCGKKPGKTRQGKPKIEAHHYLGYDEEHWYHIQWLCQSCHRKDDRRRPLPTPEESLTIIQRMT